MEKLWYFIKKFVNAIFDIHPITFIVIIILVLIMFFVSKKMLKKYSENSKYLNVKSILFSIFIGLPIIGLIFYFIIAQTLNNQPF